MKLVHKKNKIFRLHRRILKGGAVIAHSADPFVNNPILGKPNPTVFPLISSNVVGGKLNFNSKKRQNLKFVN